MVAKIIENGLSHQGFEDLLLQREKFTFRNSTTGEIELDRPIMLYLIYNKIDPDTIVGLDAIEDDLENMKLSNYGNNVDTMLTDMAAKYKILKDNRRAPRKYRKLLLDALATGQNHVFNQFIQRITNNVESGNGLMTNLNAEAVITASRAHYNNLHSKSLWNKTDPRDAQTIALTTKLKNLQKEHVALASNRQLNGDSNNENNSNANNGNCVSAKGAFKLKVTDDNYI